jgi:putative endonuclease
MQKSGSVYIMASVSKRTLYVGMTSDLEGRVWEHKNKIYPKSFTARYNCISLVYYKQYQSMAEVVDAEKQLKGGSRKDKESLIDAFNPD